MEDAIEIALVAMNAEGAVPDWIELVPAGNIVRGRDRREFFNTDPRRIVNAFHARGRPVVLDWEHSSEFKETKGQRAPAAGWIESMELRAGAVWGHVRWTPKGKADVSERGYRYISPTFTIDAKTREIKSLKSAGLVHRPNLELKALNSMDDPTDTEMAKVARALSLDPAKASIAGILSAIEKLRNAPAMNAAHDTDAYVPRRDYELAVSQLHELRERENDRREDEIEEAVNSVLRVGDPSFTPARRDEYVAMCREEGGLERFRKIMVPDPSRSLSRSVLDGHKAPSRDRDNERSIFEMMGVDPSKVRD